MAVAAVVISSAFLALWQGVGTGLAERAVETFYATGKQQQSQTDGRSGTQPVSLTPSPRPIAVSPLSPAPSDDKAILEGVVRVRAELEISSTKSANSQGQACAAAVRDMKRQADRQCERMSLENRGAAYRIENAASECRSCGAVGGGWRCVASSKPECIVTGEAE